MAVVNGIERDRNPSTPKFTITDFNEDFDCSANDAIAVQADVLATLIRELARQGIINADIT